MTGNIFFEGMTFMEHTIRNVEVSKGVIETSRKTSSPNRQEKQRKNNLFLITSEDDYRNYLSGLLKTRVAAPPECRKMLREESVDWMKDRWDESWYVPTALVQHDFIVCDTGAGTGFQCRGYMRYHPRSELLWCPGCHILFPPSFFEIKSHFVILNPKNEYRLNKKHSGYRWPENAQGAISPVCEEARKKVDDIKQEALSLGWTYPQLYQNVGIAYRDWGLVCFLDAHDEVGNITKDFIEITHKNTCTCFYNKNLEINK